MIPRVKFKALALFAALALGGAAFADEPVNVVCPVTPDEEVESYIKTEYKGVTIGFCCKKCLRKFNRDPQSYLANLEESGAIDAKTLAALQAPEPDHEASSDEHNHDHAHDHAPAEPKSGFAAFLAYLGKFHVLVVHLPIALLTLAAPLELLGRWRKSAAIRSAARVNFALGACAAIVAASLGWIAASLSEYPDTLQSVLSWHRWLGTSVGTVAIAGLIGLAASRRDRSWGKALYLATLLILVVAVPIAAHFGGSLIYGIDYLATN